MTTSVATRVNVSNPNASANGFKSYADFSNLTFEARVYNVDIVTHNGKEFAAISLITNMRDGEGQGLVIEFVNSNGLLTLARKGHLPNGRRVFVTGSINGVKSHYEKDGNLSALKTPVLSLDPLSVQLKLGATPSKKMGVTVEQAPEVA